MMMTNNTSTSTFIKIVVANLMVAALLATYMCSNDSGVGLKGSRKLQGNNLFFTIGPGAPTTTTVTNATNATNATSAPTSTTSAPTSAPIASTPTSGNLFFTIGPGRPTFVTNATNATAPTTNATAPTTNATAPTTAPITSTPAGTPTSNFPFFTPPLAGQPLNFSNFIFFGPGATLPNFFNPAAPTNTTITSNTTDTGTNTPIFQPGTFINFNNFNTQTPGLSLTDQVDNILNGVNQTSNAIFSLPGAGISSTNVNAILGAINGSSNAIIAGQGFAQFPIQP
jgi:hypothetical protein